MVGLEKGVDRKATHHGWQHTPSRLLAGVIRWAIAGAFWTQDRRYRARMVSSPLCPHCDQGVAEDLAHLWWGCPKWEDIRQIHAQAVALRQADWPPCLDSCGIIPDDLGAVATVRVDIARQVQLLMAAMLLRREQATEPTAHRAHLYQVGRTAQKCR